MNMSFLLQACRLVPDGQGGTVQAWSTLAALWGSLEDIFERADLRGSQDPTHIVMTRARSDVEVSAGQRLTYNERVFIVCEARLVGIRKDKAKLFVREQKYLN